MTTRLRIGVVGLSGSCSTYFKTPADHANEQVSALCDANPTVMRASAEQHGSARV